MIEYLIMRSNTYIVDQLNTGTTAQPINRTILKWIEEHLNQPNPQATDQWIKGYMINLINEYPNNWSTGQMNKCIMNDFIIGQMNNTDITNQLDSWTTVQLINWLIDIMNRRIKIKHPNNWPTDQLINDQLINDQLIRRIIW